METSGAAAAEAFQTANVMERLLDLRMPQPKYLELLATAEAMCPSAGLALSVSRAAAEQVLQDARTWSAAGLVNLGNVRPMIPLSIDPPAHVKYRKLLDPLFAPRKMDAIEQDIAERFNRFVDAFVDRGGCHFTDELAVPFPSAIFLGLMGLPWEELGTLLRLKDGILRPGDGHADVAEQARIRGETGQEIYGYFDAILDERKQQPRDDVLSMFLEAEVDGDRLSREEILDICFLFLIAGLDTVTDSLTCMFAFLAAHPEHRQRMAGDPTVIPAAVEELLRWETPVPTVYRVATEDTDVRGCPVAAGTVVTVMLGAANIDATEYPDATDVRFDREQNRHLAFGGGVHRCLGSHLARRELRVALREWHRRIPEYELEPGLELHYPAGLRSVENLRLVWPLTA